MALQIQSLTALLAQYANQKNRDIRSYVCEDALDSHEPISFLKDIVDFGCVSGVVSRMVSRADTQEFFDQNYTEIEKLRTEYETDMGSIVAIEGDLKNCLAWFAYEYSVQKLLEEINQHF